MCCRGKPSCGSSNSSSSSSSRHTEFKINPNKRIKEQKPNTNVNLPARLALAKMPELPELEWDSESQEATSKGEKISNIDSIMPEIYGGQRAGELERDPFDWRLVLWAIQIKIMLDILV